MLDPTTSFNSSLSSGFTYKIGKNGESSAEYSGHLYEIINVVYVYVCCAFARRGLGTPDAFYEFGGRQGKVVTIIN